MLTLVLVRELDPRCVMARYNLASTLHDLHDAARAIEEFEATLALDPTCADAQFNLAITYQGAGHLERAADAYEAAARLRPEAGRRIRTQHSPSEEPTHRAALSFRFASHALKAAPTNAAPRHVDLDCCDATACTPPLPKARRGRCAGERDPTAPRKPEPTVRAAAAAAAAAGAAEVARACLCEDPSSVKPGRRSPPMVSSAIVAKHRRPALGCTLFRCPFHAPFLAVGATAAR